MRVVSLLPILFVGVFILIPGVLGDLYYSTYQLGWKLIIVFFGWSFLHLFLILAFNISNRHSFPTYINFGNWSLTCICFSSFFVSLYFVSAQIDFFDLFSLVAFSERYRNGFYSGSFAYTFLAIFVVPIVLCHQIVYSKRLSIYFWLLLLLNLINFIIFGFRILLLNYVISFILRFSLGVHTRRSFFRILSVFFLIFLLLPTFKIFLLTGSAADMLSIYFDFLFQPLFRSKAHVLLQDSFMDFNNYYCLFPISGRFCAFSPEEIKYSILAYNDLLEIYFTSLNKFSGVAISGIVFVLNQFGFLAILVLPLFSVFYLLSIRLLFSQNLFLQLIAVQSIIVLLAFFFEDIYFFKRLDLYVFFCFVIYLFVLVGLIKTTKFRT